MSTSTPSDLETKRVRDILGLYGSQLDEDQLGEALGKLAAGGGRDARSYNSETGRAQLLFQLKQAVNADEDGLISQAAVIDWWMLRDDVTPSTQGPPAVMIRAAAGFIDSLMVGLVCVPIGMVARAGQTDSLGAVVLSASMGGLGYTFRDSIFNGGTRSIGKSMAGLEIVKMDGKFPTDEVATRGDCLIRNSYGMLGVVGKVGEQLEQVGAIQLELHRACGVCGLAGSAMGIVDLA